MPELGSFLFLIHYGRASQLPSTTREDNHDQCERHELKFGLVRQSSLSCLGSLNRICQRKDSTLKPAYRCLKDLLRWLGTEGLA